MSMIPNLHPNQDFTDLDLELAILTMMVQLNARKQKVDVIVGISRGGLIPAVHLSHLLNVPLITLTHQTRDSIHEQQEVFTDKFKEENFAGKNVLVVDDICDTGTTFRAIKEQIPNALFYSIIYKTHSTFVPDYFYEEDDTDAWIDFYWEHRDGTI